MMTLPEVTRFSAPISEEHPAGEWLRFDPIYDDIKLLRERDDPTLPQGVWQRELKKADWPGVAQLCQSALETRSKDLQLAAWMTEAWIALHGFSGFERGIHVVTSLCDTFWDSVYPAIEDGGMDSRLSPIAWLAEKLVLPLKSVPITTAAGEETMAYAWRDWESALYLANTKPTKVNAPNAPTPDGVVTQSKFLVAVSLTPVTRFAAVEGELNMALAALDGLDRALSERLNGEAPSLSSLRVPLAQMHQFVARVRAEREPLPEAAPDEFATEEERMSHDAAHPAMNGPIASRAEAYHRLRQAADYLMRTEPHSPVPYLIRRAISWGNLSLAELLEELLQKNTDLAAVNALLGIRKP